MARAKKVKTVELPTHEKYEILLNRPYSAEWDSAEENGTDTANEKVGKYNEANKDRWVACYEEATVETFEMITGTVLTK